MTADTEAPAYIEDSNGNRCYVRYFGSIEAAQAALDSLINCKNCTNCSYCTNCSDCSYCTNCTNCSGCTNCSDCSYCTNCTNCSGCSDCSYCTNCTNCTNCSGCSRCSGCTNCTNCSYCSDCTNCTNCSGCSGTVGDFIPPPVPVIASIHTAVFNAVSQPDALNMGEWHTCSTTHCRAGWVVHLAGEAGYALERFHNTALAAQLIYKASGSPISPVKFYEDNANALADMQALAEQEAVAKDRIAKEGLE